MSSDQNLGYLQYIRGIVLPSDIGIIISHHTDFYEPTSINKGFERARFPLLQVDLPGWNEHMTDGAY